MKRRLPDRSDTADDAMARAVPWIAGLLTFAATALIALFVMARPEPTPAAGTWVGRDSAGAAVVFYFGPEGAGYRSIDGVRKPLHYEVRPGYPNIIRIRFGDAAEDAVEGLFQVRDGHMRLDLALPGEPAPRQMGAGTLELDRPATR